MPAIVRVKRRIDEEPLNAFVLNGKKRRLEQCIDGDLNHDDEKEEISTVLKFAGTITAPDNTATTQFAQRLSKNEAKDLVQTKHARKAGGYTERARDELRRTSQENRFRVVNCMRTILPLAEDDECNNLGAGIGDNAAAAVVDTTKSAADFEKTTTSKSLTIVDIEKNTNETENEATTATTTTTALNNLNEAAAAEAQTPTDSDTGYVYDLYYPDDDVQARNADLMDDNYLSVHGLHDIVYEDAFNDARDEDYDSEDSNREDYYTNDYPDEDDELHSANENYEYGDNDDDNYEDGEVGDICRAVEKFVFDDDDEEENSAQDYYDGLSSDEGDDAFVAYEDPYVQCVDADSVEPDIDTVGVQDFVDVYKRYQRSNYKLHMHRQTNKYQAHAQEPTYEADDDEGDENENDNEKGKQNRSSDNEHYHSADEVE